MKTFKVFENITEIIGWLQIVASPTLLCSGIGAFIYFRNPNLTNLIIAICICMVGIVSGILYANKIWKTKGTVWFMSRVNASPELDNLNVKISPDFIAILKYKTAEEGGRKTAANSGYRPDIKFPFDKMLTCGFQTFIDQEKVLPGESVKAEIKINATEYFKGQLFEDLEFDFREGQNIIGTGKILKIVNPILKASR
jgi:hypothetical protein